jgi:uncharacterized phage protein (TIGR02218 family)
MLTVDSALATHLAAETTSEATIWKITRADAQVFRFTNHDRDIVMPADGRYLAATAFTTSAATVAEGMAAASLEAVSVFDAAAITEADLEAGVWDHARVRAWLVNTAAPANGRVPLPAGRIGQVRYDGLQYRAELLSLANLLQTQRGRMFAPGCDAELGDARCGVSLSTFTHSLTVTAVTDRASFRDSALVSSATPAGYFNFGYVTWATGANAGRSMEVKSHDADGDFVLFLPMVSAIAVGDTATVVAGCDKTVAACNDVFANVVNFRGFPLLPGINRVVATVAI